MQQHKLIDLTGKRFGRLVVKQRAADYEAYRPCWLCDCDCGRSKVVRGSSLKHGSTKSCGCLLAESSRNTLRQRIGDKNYSWRGGCSQTAKGTLSWARTIISRSRSGSLKNGYCPPVNDPEEILRLWAEAGGVCQLSGILFREGNGYDPVLDHCHFTGKLRGFICRRFNTAIGMLKEEIELAEKLLVYIKAHTCAS